MIDMITILDKFEAATIPAMEQMSPAVYRAYLQYHLFYVDHHDILRTNHGGYPLATNISQIDTFIDYLTSVRQQMTA